MNFENLWENTTTTSNIKNINSYEFEFWTKTSFILRYRLIDSFSNEWDPNNNFKHGRIKL